MTRSSSKRKRDHDQSINQSINHSKDIPLIIQQPISIHNIAQLTNYIHQSNDSHQSNGIHQSADQSISQSTNQSISQPNNQSLTVNQPVNSSSHIERMLAVEDCVEPLSEFPVNQSISHEEFDEDIKSIDQSVNQSTNQSDFDDSDEAQPSASDSDYEPSIKQSINEMMESDEDRVLVPVKAKHSKSVNQSIKVKQSKSTNQSVKDNLVNHTDESAELVTHTKASRKRERQPSPPDQSIKRSTRRTKINQPISQSISETPSHLENHVDQSDDVLPEPIKQSIDQSVEPSIEPLPKRRAGRPRKIKTDESSEPAPKRRGGRKNIQAIPLPAPELPIQSTEQPPDQSVNEIEPMTDDQPSVNDAEPTSDNQSITEPSKPNRLTTRIAKQSMLAMQKADKEIEELYKYEMVNDSVNHLIKLSHCQSIIRFHLSPCGSIDYPKGPKYPCRSNNPQCLYHCGYTRRGIWAVNQPHLNLIGPNPAFYSRSQSINQSINQPIDQSTPTGISTSAQPINQSSSAGVVNHSINQSVNQLINRSTNQSVDQLMPVGLTNLGSTCYFNILLQQLFNIDQFRSAILHYETNEEHIRQRWSTLNQSINQSISQSIPSSYNDLADIPYHLACLFTQMKLTNQSFVNPRFLVDALRLSHDEQQDAHEFRNLLIQTLDSALKQSINQSDHSLTGRLFEGQSTSVLRCCVCKQERKNMNTFMDLMLLVKVNQSINQSINQSLSSYLSHETLEDSNAVTCDHCLKKQSTIKYTRIDELPALLNVQLVRFELDHSGKKKKIAERIFLPDYLHFAGKPLQEPATADNSINQSLTNDQHVIKQPADGSDIGSGQMTDELLIEPVVPRVVKGRRKKDASSSPPSGRRGRAKSIPSLEPVTDQPVDQPVKESTVPITDQSFETDGLTPINVDELAAKSKLVNVHSYQLVGVLVHKGQFANHGHYTAMLRDDAGCWWNYDDRHVRRIGPDLWAKRETAPDTTTSTNEPTTDTTASAEVTPPVQSVPPKGRPGRKRVSPKPDTTDGAEVTPLVQSVQPKGRPGRKRLSPSLTEAPVTEINQSDAPPAPKKRGRKPVSDAVDAPLSATKASKKKSPANVERDQLEEARKKYGHGGFSKDAYMLMYACRSGGNIIVPAAEEKVESRTKVVEWTEAMIARDDAEFEREKSEFERVHAELTSRIAERKTAVESAVTDIQAQPIDMTTLRACETNNEPFVEDPESRFIPTRWLTSFLIGWNEPEKVKAGSASSIKAEADEKMDTEKDEKKSSEDVSDVSDDIVLKDEVDLTAVVEKAEPSEDSEKPHEVDTAVGLTVTALREAADMAIKHLDPGPLAAALDTIRCPHHLDCVDPRQVASFKRISLTAWEKIVDWDKLQHPELAEESQHVAGLGLKDICMECTRDIYLGDTIRARSVESDRIALDHWLDLSRDSRDKKHDLSHGYWVSREFIDQWKLLVRKRLATARATKSLDELRAAENKQRELEEQKIGSPTEDIRCEHGKMLPIERDRVLVDEILWKALLSVSSGQLDPLEQPEGGEPPLCPQCEREHKEDEEEHKAKRTALRKESITLTHWKKRCANFPNDRTPPGVLVSGTSAARSGYLLPGGFVKQLEEYHNEETDERPIVDMNQLLCEHRLLRYQPLPAPHTFNGINGVKLGVLGFAEDRDWQGLMKTGYVSVDAEPVKVTYTRNSNIKDVSIATGWDSYDIVTVPHVCMDCASAQQSAERSSKLVFERTNGGHVNVWPVTTHAEAENEAEAVLAEEIPPTGRRTRTKDRSSRMRIPASSSDMVSDIKMLILQQGESERPLEQQRLYHRGRTLADDVTLAEAGVPMGGTIKLWYSDDETVVAVPLVEARAVRCERGFQGTALARHAHGLTS